MNNLEKRCYRQSFFPPADFARISSALAEEISLLPAAPEGHISPDQAEFLYHLVRLIRPPFVVETGFCVGHSACVVLHAQQSVGIEPCLMSVDICKYEATRPAAAYIKTRFPRFCLVEGDSKVVLANAVNAYLREREGLRLHLGIIDGEHDREWALHDLETLNTFLTLGGYLWLDDFEKIVPCAGPNSAGHEFSRKWGKCQRFRTSDTRGFMVYQKSF